MAHAAAAMDRLLGLYGKLVLKPVADGSSSGLFFIDAQTRNEGLARLERSPGVGFLLERYIRGRELTVGVIDRASGETIALPCSEVLVDPGRSFDFEGKYLGQGTKEITPADIPAETADAAKNLALTVHRALGCSGCTRTDMIVDPSGPVFLEINTLPGLTGASFIPQQLEAAGIPMGAFLEEQIELAAKRPR
jgi:D-alanine-D-alanine ligase